MSVTKYKTSKGNFWQVRFRYTEKKTGKPEEIQARRDEHGEPFATKNDALAFEAELRRKYVNNGVLKPSRITVAEHCEQWFDVKKVALEATARQKYRQTLDGQILPALGAIALKEFVIQGDGIISFFFHRDVFFGRIGIECVRKVEGEG